jgi:hypothetical protein
MFSGITSGDASCVQPNEGNETRQTPMDDMARARTIIRDLGERLLLKVISCIPWGSMTG